MSGLDIDTRSDIYSLGVLLYELLIGRTPFDARDLLASGLDEMRKTIREKEPMRPSTRLRSMLEAERGAIALRRDIEAPKLIHLMRGDLDWIVMKCLEKDRARRYGTANGLGMDIQRHLRNEPVAARPPSAAYRFQKFVRRNKLVFGAAASAGLALALGAVASVWQAARAMTAERAATREQQRTRRALEAETRAKGELERTLEREQRSAYFHRITLAHRELLDNNLLKAEEFLEECSPREGQRDYRAWEWHYLKRLSQLDPVVIRDQPGWDQSAAFSPDGQRLAAASGSDSVTIWDAATGKPLLAIPGAGEVACAAFLPPDGRRLVTGGRGGAVTIWDLASGQRNPIPEGHGAAVHNLAASADGRLFASAGANRTVKVWDAATGRLVHALEGHERPVLAAAFSPDGRLLASGGFDTSVRIWDVASGKPARMDRNHKHPITSLSFSRDGRRLAVGSFERNIKIFDASTGLLERPPLIGHMREVNGVAFIDGDNRLASVSSDKTMKIWDTATGETVLTLRGSPHELNGLASSPDGRRLASISRGGTAVIWDAAPAPAAPASGVVTLRGHADMIWALAFAPDGSRAVSGSWDGTARVWDIRTGSEMLTFTNHLRIVFSVAFNAASQIIASGGAQLADDEPSYLKIWNPATGREVLHPRGKDIEAFAVAFSPDDRWIATANVRGDVAIWDAATGERQRAFQGPKRWVTSIGFSPDGRRLATLSVDGIVILHGAAAWDAKASVESGTPFRAHRASIHGNLAFSPDGRGILLPGDMNAVNLFNLTPSGTANVAAPQLTLRGHTAHVWGVAFSRDGRFIATGAEDNTVKLWDAKAGGEPLRTFRGHNGPVTRVVFSPEGKHLASASFDKTVKIWDISEFSRDR